MANSITIGTMNVSGGQVAMGDIINNQYNQQIAKITDLLHDANLSDQEREIINELKKLLSKNDESSKSIISKIGSSLKTTIGISKDTIPTLDFILKHKDVIMDTIGAIIT